MDRAFETLPVRLRMPLWQCTIYVVVGALFFIAGLLILARNAAQGSEIFATLSLCGIALLLVYITLYVRTLGLLVEEEGISFTFKRKKYERVPWASVRGFGTKPWGVGTALSIELQDETVFLPASMLGMYAARAAKGLTALLARKRGTAPSV